MRSPTGSMFWRAARKLTSRMSEARVLEYRRGGAMLEKLPARLTFGGEVGRQVSPDSKAPVKAPRVEKASGR
jgi:hypothetical protein